MIGKVVSYGENAAMRQESYKLLNQPVQISTRKLVLKHFLYCNSLSVEQHFYLLLLLQIIKWLKNGSRIDGMQYFFCLCLDYDNC